MTPEERTKQMLVSERYYGFDGRFNVKELTEDIASTMRAAENDALDRAADAVLRESCDSFVSAAAFIRTLKHK